MVAIRDKLRRGKRLENWELDYYRTHRAVVELRGVESAEEQGGKGGCWNCWGDGNPGDNL